MHLHHQRTRLHSFSATSINMSAAFINMVRTINALDCLK